MGECNLLCNISRCGKEVINQAWVTSCSHIICTNHEEPILRHGNINRCPACNNPLQDKHDIILQNLKPGEQQKSMLLAGLSPDKVLDVAQRAITFWMYQMYQERAHSQLAIKNAKERAAALTDYCETVAAKHKIDEQKMNRNIEMLQNEIAEKTKKMEEMVLQLAEKSRLNKTLQNKYDSLKRETTSKYLESALETTSPFMYNEMDRLKIHNPQMTGCMRSGSSQEVPTRFDYRYDSPIKKDENEKQ